MYCFLHQSNPLLLIIISVLFFSFQNHRSCCQAQVVEPYDPVLVSCPPSSANYTSGSQFESNLKDLLLPTLLSKGPLTNGYFNFTAGRNNNNNNNTENVVYGLVQCRGDISMRDCQTCLNVSSADMLQKCPNKLDATIRYEKCLLRYSNVSFFSQADSRMLVRLMFSTENVSDPAAFNRTLGELLDEFVSDFNSTRPNSNFQIGSKGYQGLKNVSGLVQCTQDLSVTDCLSCLQALINYIPTVPNIYGKRGARVISKSCVLRYEDYVFYDQLTPSPSPSPSPQAPPSPPPSTTPPPPPQPQVPPSPPPSTTPPPPPSQLPPSSNVGVTVGPIVAGVTLIIALCVCYITM